MMADLAADDQAGGELDEAVRFRPDPTIPSPTTTACPTSTTCAAGDAAPGRPARAGAARRSRFGTDVGCSRARRRRAAIADPFVAAVEPCCAPGPWGRQAPRAGGHRQIHRCFISLSEVGAGRTSASKNVPAVGQQVPAVAQPRSVGSPRSPEKPALFPQRNLDRISRRPATRKPHLVVVHRQQVRRLGEAALLDPLEKGAWTVDLAPNARGKHRPLAAVARQC